MPSHKRRYALLALVLLLLVGGFFATHVLREPRAEGSGTAERSPVPLGPASPTGQTSGTITPTIAVARSAFTPPSENDSFDERVTRGRQAFVKLSSAASARYTTRAYKLEKRKINSATRVESIETRYHLSREGRPPLDRLDIEAVAAPGSKRRSQITSYFSNETGYYVRLNDVAFLMTEERNSLVENDELGALLPANEPTPEILASMGSQEIVFRDRPTTTITIDTAGGIFGPNPKAAGLPAKIEALIDTGTNLLYGHRTIDHQGKIMQESIYTSVDTSVSLSEKFFDVPATISVHVVKTRAEASLTDRMARKLKK